MKGQARQLDSGAESSGLLERGRVVEKLVPMRPVATLLRANCVDSAARLAPIFEEGAASSGPIDQAITARSDEPSPHCRLALAQVVRNPPDVLRRNAHHALRPRATVSRSTAPEAKRISAAGIFHFSDFSKSVVSERRSVRRLFECSLRIDRFNSGAGFRCATGSKSREPPIAVAFAYSARFRRSFAPA